MTETRQINEIDVTIEDEAISSIVARQPKLNELNDHQMEALKEAVKDTFKLGYTVGFADGQIKALEFYGALMKRALLFRTFFSSLSAVPVSALCIMFTKSLPLVVFLTATLNTLGFYLMDLMALGLNNIRVKLNERARSSQNKQAGES